MYFSLFLSLKQDIQLSFRIMWYQKREINLNLLHHFVNDCTRRATSQGHESHAEKTRHYQISPNHLLIPHN